MGDLKSNAIFTHEMFVPQRQSQWLVGKCGSGEQFASIRSKVHFGARFQEDLCDLYTKTIILANNEILFGWGSNKIEIK